MDKNAIPRSLRKKTPIEELQYRLRSTKAVLAERERELLFLKGPCSTRTCRLHFAHSGPCNIHLSGS